MLEGLKRDGVVLAVLSNKSDDAVKKLCDRYFSSLLDLAYGEQEGVPRKPSPIGIERILSVFSAERGQTVYVGDSETDIQTAKNARVRSILVDWGFRSRRELLQSGAERIVSDPGEITWARIRSIFNERKEKQR